MLLIVPSLWAYTPQVAPWGVANVLAYGATGNGVTNDTAAVQAAASSGLPVFFPTGKYLLGLITLTNCPMVYGAGPYFEGTNGVLIIPPNNTSTVFYVNTAQPITFRDLGFSGYVSNSTGAMIQIDDTTASGTANLFACIDNCIFDSCHIGVQIVRASSWTITGSVFWNISSNGCGVFIDNVFNKDQGDQSISACTFNMTTWTNADGIAWQGGGGLRIMNNKFFGGAPIVVNAGGANGAPTGQIYIEGNSIDNVTNPYPGINIFNTTGSNFFGGITIIGNAMFAYGTLDAFISISGSSNGSFGIVTISANSMFFSGASVILGGAGVALTGVTNFNYNGNTLIGSGGGTGLVITASGNGYVTGNMATNWTANIVTNASGNPPSVHIGNNY